jgi:hypothetical protein
LTASPYFTKARHTYVHMCVSLRFNEAAFARNSECGIKLNDRFGEVFLIVPTAV